MIDARGLCSEPRELVVSRQRELPFILEEEDQAVEGCIAEAIGVGSTDSVVSLCAGRWVMLTEEGPVMTLETKDSLHGIIHQCSCWGRQGSERPRWLSPL